MYKREREKNKNTKFPAAKSGHAAELQESKEFGSDSIHCRLRRKFTNTLSSPLPSGFQVCIQCIDDNMQRLLRA